jgi:hypothetical protein
VSYEKHKTQQTTSGDEWLDEVLPRTVASKFPQQTFARLTAAFMCSSRSSRSSSNCAAAAAEAVSIIMVRVGSPRRCWRRRVVVHHSTFLLFSSRTRIKDGEGRFPIWCNSSTKCCPALCHIGHCLLFYIAARGPGERNLDLAAPQFVAL